MSGWIRVHRSFLDNPIFNGYKLSRGEAWVQLLLLANHKPTEFLIDNVAVKVGRGELAWSQKKLAQKWGWSLQNIRTYLKMLQRENMIVVKSNTHTSIITICNYCKYQDIDLEDNTRLTHDQHTGNTRVTPYNNVNNVNNENKLKDIRAYALVTKQKKQPKDFNGKDCEAIFSYWKVVMGYPQSQLLEKRKKLIQKTLDSGYTPIQAKLAIDGHKNSKWHKENGFDGIEYSLKPENIDKFIKMAGMTGAELNRTSGTINWDDTSWADGLQAEYGVRDRDIGKATKN